MKPTASGRPEDCRQKRWWVGAAPTQHARAVAAATRCFATAATVDDVPPLEFIRNVAIIAQSTTEKLRLWISC